jgi:hypothetical protein
LVATTNGTNLSVRESYIFINLLIFTPSV